MSLSIGLLPVLLFLAPGLAALVGITLGSLSRRFRQSPPALGTATSLAIVVFASIVAHSAGLFLNQINVNACANGCPLPAAWDSDLYGAARSSGRQQERRLAARRFL